MKNLIILFVTITATNFAIAQNTDLSKSYFVDAKKQLESMLNGREEANYEKAIFIVENAWYGNQIDKASFDYAIDSKISAIKQLITDNYDDKVFKKDMNSLHHKPNAEELYNKALTNWAIYTYITNSPYTYSFADPMATEDWRNSQVVNLNNTAQGNCFALASLFKILSNRLNSDATLCTAPSHIYISHEDEKGTSYNIELGSRKFPGTGTLATLTHSTMESIRSGVSLRRLKEQQSIALSLVYLAKGYQHKFNVTNDGFMMNCSITALKFDKLNLNAMLLKLELFESELTHSSKSIAQLRNDSKFIEYEKLIASLYQLGYREMPLPMKDQLIKGWSKDTVTALANNNYNLAETKISQLLQSRKASLSWGMFDEEFAYKPIERYGNALFDCKTKKIKRFAKEQNLYNNYNFDPVVFAWNIDPLAHQYPYSSPYSAFNNNPIFFNDPTGKSGVAVIDKQARTITITMNIKVYGAEASVSNARDIASKVQSAYNDVHGTSTINGIKYNVKFEINGEYKVSNSLVGLEMEENADYMNNYIRLEKNTKDGASYTDQFGANSGYWSTEQMANSKTTEAHEVNHMLGGLNHPEDIDPSGGNNDQNATIEMTEMSYNYTNSQSEKSMAEKGIVTDVTQRKVTQGNIDAILNASVKKDLESNGKANIGTLTNKYHEKEK